MTSNINNMVQSELIFIPAPGMGHLVSTVELAELLIRRNSHLSVTFLIINHAMLFSTTNTLIVDKPRIRFISLPPPITDSTAKTTQFNLTRFVESHIPQVKQVVAELTRSGSGRRLVGFVVDMFCMSITDVADEFKVPTYAFFTSGAAYLGLMFHLLSHHDDRRFDFAAQFQNLDTELIVPVCVKPVPVKVLPSIVIEKVDGLTEDFFYRARNLLTVKGILVNTARELESHAMSTLCSGGSTNKMVPTVYSVGPILNLDGVNESHRNDEPDIISWLDDQPPSSVVFLCFGSMGAFLPEQIMEIAQALESSGYRFLWALRQSTPNTTYPTDYADYRDVLPGGFLDRTYGSGKIIGWAPQVKVLSHKSIGGFVTHCGWNSILESLWHGVPVAAWPMYAEQQMNAFLLVKELGLAAEIKMDYRKDFRIESHKNVAVVSAEEIEKGIRCLMDHDSEVRKNVEEMKEKCRNSLLAGGSSYESLGRFIEDVVHNV